VTSWRAELRWPGRRTCPPSPLVVAELGAARLSASSFPEPLYIRQADVRIGWEQVGGRVRGTVASGPGHPADGAPRSSPPVRGPARPKLGPLRQPALQVGRPEVLHRAPCAAATCLP